MKFFLLFALLILPFQVKAADSCTKARTTADIISCESQRHKIAQESLNTSFDHLTKAKGDEELGVLKTVQKDWLSYRDQECKIEAQQVEEKSLQRIQELRCLTRITEERLLALQALSVDETEKPIEVEGQPRWMNALASDHPDVFWKFGSSFNIDLDCDEDEEIIMTGLRVEPTTQALNAVVAVAENPETGRPSNQIFALYVMPDDQEEKRHVCNSSLNLRSVKYPRDVENCTQALEISDAKCSPHILYFEEGAYAFYEELETSEDQ